MKNLIKSETMFSVLVAVALFSIIFLIYIQWQSRQHQQSLLTFQRLAALQIAENQIARRMAGMPCESQFKQNKILFRIYCIGDNIKIQFPLGEIVIGKAQ